MGDVKITDEDRDRAVRLRREAGLPDMIEDPSFLAKIAALMAVTRYGDRPEAGPQRR